MPVVLATACAGMAEVERLVGARFIRGKPFDLAELARAVAAALAQR